MARACGSSAHLLMKRETAYGQAAIDNYIRVPFNRCNLGSEQGLIDDPTLGERPGRSTLVAMVEPVGYALLFLFLDFLTLRRDQIPLRAKALDILAFGVAGALVPDEVVQRLPIVGDLGRTVRLKVASIPLSRPSPAMDSPSLNRGGQA
jgi:hypothetical protein